MPYYFLKEDLDALRARVRELEEDLRVVGRELGEACSQSAETWHDNAPYEEAVRESKLLSRRLKELVDVLREAELVTPPSSAAKRVSIGRNVTVLDLDTGEELAFTVGSYLVLDNAERRSYRAPLVRLLILAEEGDIREGKIGNRHRAFEVVRIE